MRAKCPTRTCEWPRNDAPHAVRPVEQFPRNFAHAIKFRDRDHVFMRGNLKDAVARSVDNRFSRANVLFAEFLDDFRAGCGLVPKRATPNLFFKFRDLALAGNRADRPGKPDPAKRRPSPNGRWSCLSPASALRLCHTHQSAMPQGEGAQGAQYLLARAARDSATPAAAIPRCAQE